MAHATWPDVAMVFLIMVFIMFVGLLAGAAEAAKRDREKKK
jgi:hypothetical protein